MITNDYKIFTNADMSATLHSVPIFVDQISGLSAQLNWSSTPVGTFVLEFSDDNVPDSAGSSISNWDTVPDSSTPISGSGRLSYKLADNDYRWIRITYTPTSGGSASLNGTLVTKGN